MKLTAHAVMAYTHSDPLLHATHCFHSMAHCGRTDTRSTHWSCSEGSFGKCHYSNRYGYLQGVEWVLQNSAHVIRIVHASCITTSMQCQMQTCTIHTRIRQTLLVHVIVWHSIAYVHLLYNTSTHMHAPLIKHYIGLICDRACLRYVKW